ncbi:MAG: N-acetylmuramoyl-L-alanine amidase [Muribaculaceae bacterium]|nr:N-acetylmuramoyl-L-alanine amidase [Muribaculaceae bacterium]
MNILHKALTLLLFLVCLPAAFAAGKDGFTVVLDPGHGGKDYGAVGLITYEKTINLNVALEIRRLLADAKELNIVMTRDDDRFIALQERANIANRNHGDLFVSIHVNSVAKNNKNRLSIAGASVYTLGLHRTASNLEVAKRENAVMELESDYSTKYQGFDPNSTESYIMFELSQNKHLDQSINFADMTVARLCKNAGRRNRGVLQAGFWVLHASAMPSVLIELDFICNPTCEKYLNSKEGVSQMAQAIADAILQYTGCRVEHSENSEHSERSENSENSENSESSENSTPSSAKLTYRIQILASSISIPQGSARFKGAEKVEEYQQGGWFKYTAGGDFETDGEAERYARQHLRGAFPEAFIIKWQNGQRVN